MQDFDEEMGATVEEILEPEGARRRLASIYSFILECGEKRRAREREAETSLPDPPEPDDG